MTGTPGIIPRFTASAEWLLARSSVACRLYARPYVEVVRSEIQLAAIQPGERILNIGCGPAPFTAMLLANYGYCVTAMDCDSRATDYARRALRRGGYQDRVEAVVGNPAVDPIPPFDVALVALQVRPKDEVVARLLRQSPPGGRVLVRESASWCTDMYDSLSTTLPRAGTTVHRRGALHRTVCVTRESEGWGIA